MQARHLSFHLCPDSTRETSTGQKEFKDMSRLSDCEVRDPKVPKRPNLLILLGQI